MGGHGGEGFGLGFHSEFREVGGYLESVAATAVARGVGVGRGRGGRCGGARLLQGRGGRFGGAGLLRGRGGHIGGGRAAGAGGSEIGPSASRATFGQEMEMASSPSVPCHRRAVQDFGVFVNSSLRDGVFVNSSLRGEGVILVWESFEGRFVVMGAFVVAAVAALGNLLQGWDG